MKIKQIFNLYEAIKQFRLKYIQYSSIVIRKSI